MNELASEFVRNIYEFRYIAFHIIVKLIVFRRHLAGLTRFTVESKIRNLSSSYFQPTMRLLL